MMMPQKPKLMFAFISLIGIGKLRWQKLFKLIPSQAIFFLGQLNFVLNGEKVAYPQKRNPN